MMAETGFYPSPREGLPHIMIVDDGEYVHYPASPSDVFSVLGLLPSDAVCGIPIIDFRLENDPSSDSVEEETAEFPPARTDPLTGRLGIEIVPGVFSSPICGSIRRPTRRIVLTADVYDPAIPDREMWELFLRFHALSTLVHEVGHHAHFSSLQRTDPIEPSVAEQQAETLAYQWTEQIVVPYLQAEHTESVRLLEDWASTWAGHPIMLNDLIDEPRALPDDPSFFAAWRLAPAWLVIPRLAYAVAEGRSREHIHGWFTGYLKLRQLDR